MARLQRPCSVTSPGTTGRAWPERGRKPSARISARAEREWGEVCEETYVLRVPRSVRSAGGVATIQPVGSSRADSPLRVKRARGDRARRGVRRSPSAFRPVAGGPGLAAACDPPGLSVVAQARASPCGRVTALARGNPLAFGCGIACQRVRSGSQSLETSHRIRAGFDSACVNCLLGKNKAASERSSEAAWIDRLDRSCSASVACKLQVVGRDAGHQEPP